MISITPPQEANVLPDLTSMLDILFIVMVFLLLIVNIPIQSVEIAVPKTAEQQVLASTTAPPITINIVPNSPYWALNGKSYIDFSAFAVALDHQRKTTNQPILIGADDLAPAGKMLQLLAYFKDKNISNTHIMMENQG